MERWLLAKWVRPRAAGLHCAAYRWAGCREATLRAASRWTQQGRAQRAEAAEAGGGDDDGGGPGPGPGTGTGTTPAPAPLVRALRFLCSASSFVI